MNSFTDEELKKAKALSPAVCRYLHLIESKPSTASNIIKINRHHSWLNAAVATLNDLNTPESVCRQWSNDVDNFVAHAWKLSGGDSIGCGVFALGKLGAEELNISSDIDIMFISEKAPDSEVITVVRSFVKILSEVNEYGFCCRVDTDLRPGGRLGPLVTSIAQYRDYYWNQGATWERLALVRLRPIVGPTAIINKVLSVAHKFSFRRYIDFSLFDELKNLRQRIHEKTPAATYQFIDLKLAPGGIRDIELFIHALQIIHGGKFPEIQTHSTTKAVTQLEANKLFDPISLNRLIDTYWALRRLENYVQAKDDHQSHICSLNEPAPFDFSDKLRESMAWVDTMASDLLGRGDSSHKKLPDTLENQQSWLKSMGASESLIKNTWPDLMSRKAISGRSDRDEQIRRGFLYQFVETLHAGDGDLNLGLGLLLDFIRSTRAKATFFSLLIHKPMLLKEIASIFSTSPHLGGIVASRPELMDSLVYRIQDDRPKNLEDLLEDLTERRLISEILSGSEILRTKDVVTLGNALTDTADEIASSLLNKLKELHGPSEVGLLTLGKWGGRELGFRSDLDFIFVTSNTVTPEDQKVTRRFISHMTEKHRGGALFEIDLRLRPSGRSGPLLVSEDQFIDYAKTKAAAWERQSYLRSRWLSSNRTNFAELAAQIGLSSADLLELRNIRQKLIRHKKQGQYDLKYQHGGLLDIEFAAQTTFLYEKVCPPSGSTFDMIQFLCDNQKNWQEKGPQLKETYLFLRLVEQLQQLASHHSGSTVKESSDSLKRILKLLNSTPQGLFQKLQDSFKLSAEALKSVDPIWTP